VEENQEFQSANFVKNVVRSNNNIRLKKSITGVRLFTNRFKKIKYLAIYVRLCRAVLIRYKKGGEIKKKKIRRRKLSYKVLAKQLSRQMMVEPELWRKRKLLKKIRFFYKYKHGIKYKKRNLRFTIRFRKYREHNKKNSHKQKLDFKKEALNRYHLFYLKAKKHKMSRQPFHSYTL